MSALPPIRPFRFGVSTFQAPSGEAWRAKARRAEENGYAVFLVPDHLGARGLAPMAGLVAAADVTTTLRIGTFVLDNNFHHPAVLQKELATLDVLSGGRLEIGIGAGWARDEFVQAGIPFESPAVRLDRLAESVAIVKGLFGPDPLTFHGTHYHIEHLVGSPPPLQRPHPPIFIGGARRRLLELGARDANIVGLGPRFLPDGSADLSSITAAVADEQIGWIRAAAGQRMVDIELNILLQRVIVTDDRERETRTLASQWGLPPEDLLDSPHVLIGTIEQMASTLQERRERYGISYVSVFEDAAEAFALVVGALFER